MQVSASTLPQLPPLLLILILPIQLISLLLSFWKFSSALSEPLPEFLGLAFYFFELCCVPSLSLELDRIVGCRPNLKNPMVSLGDVLPTEETELSRGYGR